MTCRLFSTVLILLPPVHYTDFVKKYSTSKSATHTRLFTSSPSLSHQSIKVEKSAMQCFLYSLLMQDKEQIFLFTENRVQLEGHYHRLPSQHGIRMSSENLWIHNKTCAIYKKCHFLWCLGMNITSKAHSAVSKSFCSNKGFMVPFSPTWEA